nr:hypothetical protein [Mammaliicoccus lentus]
MGIENEIEQEEVDEADVVILAIAIGIDGEERFEEKEEQGKVLTVDPGDMIKHPDEILDQSEKL